MIDYAKLAVWTGALVFCVGTWTGVIWVTVAIVQALT